jgi:hypothetical protein
MKSPAYFAGVAWSAASRSARQWAERKMEQLRARDQKPVVPKTAPTHWLFRLIAWFGEHVFAERRDRDPEQPAVAALLALSTALGLIGLYLIARYGWALATFDF